MTSEDKETRTYTEQVDTVKVVQLLKSDQQIESNQVKYLLNYYRHGGKLEVQYTKSNKNNLWYAKGGAQNLSKEYRSYLFRDNYYDIDIVNSLPSILYQSALELMAKDDYDTVSSLIDVDTLHRYIENRDQILENLGITKQTVLVAINREEKYSDQTEAQRFLKSIQNTAKGVILYHNNDHLYLYKIQAKILEDLERKFSESKIGVAASIFDGVIVEKDQRVKSIVNSWNRDNPNIKIIIKPWTDYEPKPLPEKFDWNHPLTIEEIDYGLIYSSLEECFATNYFKLRQTIRNIERREYIVKKLDKKYSIIKANNLNYAFHIKKNPDKQTTRKVNIKDLIELVPELFAINDITVWPNIPNTFSLFPGFLITEEDDGSDHEEMVRPILNHIKEVWCSDVQEHYEFIMDWLAWTIQKFPRKTNTILLINGDEGTGKSCLFEWITEKIYGNLAICLAEADKLTRSFNAHLIGKILVCLEELGTDKHDLNKIKHIVTSTTLDYEKKGIDLKTDINAINLICFSNNDRPLPAITGINRRLVQLRSSPKYRNDPEYFNNLFHYLNNTPRVDYHLFHFLKNRKINEFRLFNQKPVTDDKLLNQWQSLCDVDKTVYWIIKTHKKLTLTPKDFLVHIKTLIQDSKYTPIGVGRRLSALGFKLHRESHIREYTIDKDSFKNYSDELAKICEELVEVGEITSSINT